MVPHGVSSCAIPNLIEMVRGLLCPPLCSLVYKGGFSVCGPQYKCQQASYS